MSDHPVSLESILRTEELRRRPSRPPDHQTENRALVALSQALADSPRTILQSLADTILEVLQCDSAGLSLVTEDGRRFYWPAIAGAWKPHVGGGTPRDFGPCGDVLDQSAPLLFTHPERRYPYLLGARPSAEEALLIPFLVGGQAVGTIWAMAHDDRRRFDAEDLRQLESIGRFASAAYRAVKQLEADDARRATLNLMEDAVSARRAIESVNVTLRESERRFREMIDAMPAAVYTTDAEGRITHWNPAAAALAGRTPEPSDRWCVSWRIYRPDGTLLPQDQFPMAVAVREGRAIRGEQILVERPDGVRRWVEPFPSPFFDGEGRVVGAVNMLVDITEHKLAEEARSRIAAIVESSDDAIFAQDLDGIITSWNDGAERLFGYTAEEVVGRLIPPDPFSAEAFGRDRADRAKFVERFETVRQRKDGTSFDASVTVSPIRDEHGAVVGVSRIVRDISERKKTEHASRESDRRKDEFLAMLAHELRNPLAPIRFALEVIRRSRTTDGSDSAEDVDTSVDMLERQVGQMIRLVDDLLDVNRISRGTIELRRQTIELSSLMHEAVEAVRSQVECMSHELTLTLPPEPVYLDADAARLMQVVGNLLTNACKFTEKGGHISLTVERDESDVVLSVRDNGIGIAADQLPRIFEMFTQLDTSLERTQSGLGIGLSLVKRIVELHGGSVEARSAGAGRGSEFVVRLPVVETPLPAPRPITPREAAPPQALRILVVDDNRDSGESLAILLQLRGHEAHLAHDGLEAVAAAARLQPDVILMDIGLPGLNGYDAAHRIREQQGAKRPVIVALTGWGQAEDRRRSEEAGFDAHLVKPVDHVGLMKLLVQLGAGDRAE